MAPRQAICDKPFWPASYGRVQLPVAQKWASAPITNHAKLLHTTYLGGDGILFSGVALRVLSLLSLLVLFAAGLFDATDANVDKAGSWIEALLPCRCCVYDATVELDDGRDMSWPIDGSLSSKGALDGVLKAGKSNACSIEGRRKESLAWGRGRIEVASAEAVVNIRVEKRVALLVGLW